MNIEQIIQRIQQEEYDWYIKGEQKAKQRFLSIAKPLNSLGRLEECIQCLCGIQAMREKKVEEQVLDFNKRMVIVFCADNGIVEENVTQTGSEVTAIVAHNMLRHQASINLMSEIANIEVLPVDVGMLSEIQGLRTKKQGRGTKNFKKEPSMTIFQADQTMMFGYDLAMEKIKEGYQLFVTGEMGIGNTTTSSAIASVLLDKPVEYMTGPGAGLTRGGIEHKIELIQNAIVHYNLTKEDPVKVLCCVGGFDLAAMVGFYLGAATGHTAVIMDGFISTVAALLATRLCPEVSRFLLASHVSKEPAAKSVLDALGKKPLLCCDMCLGEGTGGVAAIPLLDMARQEYMYMPTFQEIAIKEYQQL